MLSTGQTVRYHTNPTMIRYLQTVADHAWGVVTILYLMHPDPSPALIKAAHFHDSGEKWAGDLAAPFKKNFPVFARQHAEIEHELAVSNGIPKVDLTVEEELWLNFADKLESHIYMAERGLHSGVGPAVVDLANRLGLDWSRVDRDYL